MKDMIMRLRIIVAVRVIVIDNDDSEKNMNIIENKIKGIRSHISEEYNVYDRNITNSSKYIRNSLPLIQ